MTLDEYKSALKQVKSEAKKESYFMLSFGYSNTFILPYSKANELLNSLEGALKYEDRYGQPPIIGAIKSEDVRMSPFSHKELENIQVAALLKVPLSEIRELDL